VYGFWSTVAEADFFREDAKRNTALAVKKVEAHTSAEVVVAVRRRSGDYRVAAYHLGFVLGGAVVLFLLITPERFSVAEIALDGALGFGLGLLVAFNVSAVLRACVREKVLSERVRDAAHAAFFDLGISRTTGRNGVLVFVSTFEQRALVVTDFGIDTARLEPAWSEACADLTQAVKRRDVPAFDAAVERLGPILAALMPRSSDDVNELPDEVR
jgi:putative membrane protein